MQRAETPEADVQRHSTENSARPHIANARTPRREWQERLIRVIAIIALSCATYWIYWRWMYTVNTDPKAVIPSVLLLLAETWAYVNMCLFVLLTWNLTERHP